MIVYVDTPSLVKLMIDEDGSDAVGRIWDAAEELVSISLVAVEGRAALAAARRAGRLTESQHRRARTEFARLLDELAVVAVTDDLVAHAVDLADDLGLRGHDAVHLAAALATEVTVFSSADDALCTAAATCGLHVANPLDTA